MISKETEALLEAVQTVTDAVNKILDSETNPQEGAALSGSIQLVTAAVSGYTLMKEMMTLPDKQINDGTS